MAFLTRNKWIIVAGAVIGSIIIGWGLPTNVQGSTGATNESTEHPVWFDDMSVQRIVGETTTFVERLGVEEAIRDEKTFYVSPEGNDRNSGTLERPWKTLAHAARQATPGDTVFMMPGEYDGVLRPARSGTADAPIVFKAFERRKARFVGDATGSAHILQLSGVEHIHVEGFHIQPRSSQGRWMIIDNSKHIRIDDMFMEKATGSMPFHITHSEQVHVRDSVIREYIGGNMARVSYSKWILFEGNAISRTGHSPFQFYPVGSNQYVVVRSNVFHPAWGRAFEFFATRDLLFEGNIVTNAYDGGRSASTNAKILSENGIFRFNRVFRNWGGPISASPQNEWQFRGIRLYHNVFDDNLDYGLSTNLGAPNVGNVKYVNNIFTRNDLHGVDRQVQFSGTARPEITPGGQYTPRLYFLSNVLVPNDTSIKATIGFGTQSFDLSTVESDVWHTSSLSTRGAFFSGNMDVSPQFVDQDIYNHALTPDSPLLDGGYFLATTIGSGEGHVIRVDDAAFFYDSFGIEDEVGDLIAIGSTDQIARVVGVDRESNEITLDRLVRWDDGVPVSLPWSGHGPDIGAYEHGAGGRPSVQVVASPFIVRPDEPVNLSVVLHAMKDPVEIRWQLGDGTLAYGPELIHRYGEPYDYPIRVRVTTASGEIVRGVGYVVVEWPREPADPLVHSTFDDDDEDWWWLWKSYRPTPTDWARELDHKTGNGILRVSNPGGGTLPLKLAPIGWDIDRYPWIYLRYRVSPGTPIGFYLDTFRGIAGDVRKWIAATPSEWDSRSGRRTPYELIDDGNWHTLLIDARIVREDFPDVQVLRRLGAETLSGANRGDTYSLDEAAILPSGAFDYPDWQAKLAPMQRGHVDVLSPTPGTLVRGEITISPVLTSYLSPIEVFEEARVSEIHITLDGRLLAVTDDFRIATDVRVDTTELSDGPHEINVTYKDGTGAMMTRHVSFTVRNWETMKDGFKPPETWSFFGETMITDHRQTTLESDGWAYTVDLEVTDFQNVTGKVKTSDGDEFLIWDAPGMRTFETIVYAKTNNIKSVIQTMINTGDPVWIDLPFVVEEAASAGNGWMKYVIKGHGPEDGEVASFKLQVGSEAKAGQFRVEEVSMEIKAL